MTVLPENRGEVEDVVEDDEREALVGHEDKPLPTEPLEVESYVGEGGGYEEQTDQHFVNNKPAGTYVCNNCENKQC